MLSPHVYKQILYMYITARVRLIGGATSLQGRAEFYDISTHQWGTICDKLFSPFGWPLVLCLDLGYSGVIEVVHDPNNQTGPITMHNPACNPGSAKNMTDCRTYNPCGHEYDVFIKCKGKFYLV